MNWTKGAKGLDSTYTREKQIIWPTSMGRNPSDRKQRYWKCGQVQTPRSNCDDGKSNTRRIKAAGWSCFGRFKDILCDRKLPMSRLSNQCVIPTMTYEAEIWTTTKQLEQKLITAQRAMERRMLNITIRDKIRNSEIRKQTQVKDIMVKIKAKWRWIGHLIHRDDNRWTRRVTEWQPRNGKRTRGRQKRRWRDDLTT